MATWSRASRLKPAMRPQKAEPTPAMARPEAVRVRVTVAGKRVWGTVYALAKAPLRGPKRARPTSRVKILGGMACSSDMTHGPATPSKTQKLA